MRFSPAQQRLTNASSPSRAQPALLRAAIAAAVAEAGGPPPDPAQQAAQFVAAFREAYGERVPAFLQQGWSQATSVAHGQFKFLFVYLHSPEHEVCAAVCGTADCL
jgi:FAS-associated factor 2